MVDGKMIIEHSTYIHAPVEQVYEILTTESGWDSWFTSGTQIDLKVGGFIKVKWKDFGPYKINAEDGGKIIELHENKQFTFQWKPGDSITNVSFTLEPFKSGTLLTVLETGFSNSERDVKACLDCATGWGEALTLLKFFIEHGVTYGEII